MCRFDEQEKLAQFGIYYDDEYDYLQHLRETGAPDAVRLDAVPRKGKEVCCGRYCKSWNIHAARISVHLAKL